MNLLLDTHALLWFLRDDPHLSSHARLLIEDASHQKFVSVASCWEIAIKAGIGKLQLAEPSETLLRREIAKNNFQLMPIQLDHATAVEKLPLHHRDPFDRLLIVQAKIEVCSIVGNDPTFDDYGVSRLW